MLATLTLAAAAIAPCAIDALEVRGLHRVRLEVVEELLPRALPTCLRDDELAELQRRLWALGSFDDVQVARRGAVLDARAIWDRLEWHDLAPHGARFMIAAQPGLFFRPGIDSPRHEATTQLLSSLRLGPRTALS